MNRRELVGFLASVPALAALAGQIEAGESTPSASDEMGAVGTKLLYENDQVKVWEFALEPGEAIPMHTHTMDYLFHVYEGSTLEVSFADNQPKASVELKAGDVRFIPKGGRHTARNTGAKKYVEVLVELKK
ncbi:MAG TPA: cupin domain-containing protein [Pyrinomonadaceae bacterium]|jgi:quercetin dioxygenase-like cupin family protein|nr:cupin domain-containing protein [Pyrinomonadaceae bacterium]